MPNRGPIQTIPGLIAKARVIHGDTYDYSKVESHVTAAKVTIICPIHGEFKQSWNAHVHAKTGCWQCGVLKRQLTKRKGRSYWVEQATKIHKNKFDYTDAKLDTVHEKITLTCDKHGPFDINFSSHIYDNAACPKCDKYTSIAEQEIADFVTSLGVKIDIKNRQVLEGKELDIYIPHKNVGIELNGIFWHSTRAETGTAEDRNYKASKRQINKHIAAKEKNIHLIQIWEDEWRDRKEAVKLIIKAALGFGDKYHARKCEVGAISKEHGNNFLNTFHVQGAVNGASTFYALSYRGIIVAVMAFGISSSIRGNSSVWELMRFASIGRVRGGGSKLLKAFERDHSNVKKLVSYCDNRLFKGTSYLKYGFVVAKVCPPDYMVVHYTKTPVRKHKTWSKKQALYRRFNITPDARTELQLTHDLKLGRVYDCGKTKFVKEY